MLPRSRLFGRIRKARARHEPGRAHPYCAHPRRDRGRRGAVPDRHYRQLHHAAAEPHCPRSRATSPRRQILRCDRDHDGQRADRLRARRCRGPRGRRRHPQIAAAARGARSAVRDLLCNPGVRVLSAAHHPVRAWRHSADRDRFHARGHRDDREYAERPRPGAAGAHQDRAHGAHVADRDGTENDAALRRAASPHRRQARACLRADRDHRHRIHHVAGRHGLRDRLCLHELRQCGDVSADRFDPAHLHRHQRRSSARGNGVCWRGGGCDEQAGASDDRRLARTGAARRRRRHRVATPLHGRRRHRVALAARDACAIR